MQQSRRTDDTLPDIERQLRALAVPLDDPEPGDWLAEHHEKGQTFRQYLSANPIRRGRELTTFYLCLVGGFDEAQEQIVERTQEYLQLFFDVPVQIRRRLPVSEIPARARRKHPEWGDKQILTTFILHEVLEPDRPDDALAYLALTARDLWPGKGWNFVFGQANLRRRVGVLSLYRHGYPGPGEEAFRLCLRRTLQTASHETGHMLTMRHCTAFSCLMNGCNHHAEQDRQPLYPCPVCLRKLLWNLSVEPLAYLRRLAGFLADQGLEDAAWFERAVEILEGEDR
jgi:archaemetzincin